MKIVDATTPPITVLVMVSPVALPGPTGLYDDFSIHAGYIEVLLG